MIVQVHLLAFRDGDIREVTIPSDTPESEVLETTFRFGQNDFQPQRLPSVSVGDVIEFRGYHLVMPMGFKTLTPQEYEAHCALPRIERTLTAFND